MVWSGLFLPAGTPAPIAATLAEATAAVPREEEARRWAERYDSSRMHDLALERSRGFIEAQIERWRRIVELSGARLAGARLN